MYIRTLIAVTERKNQDDGDELQKNNSLREREVEVFRSYRPTRWPCRMSKMTERCILAKYQISKDKEKTGKAFPKKNSIIYKKVTIQTATILIINTEDRDREHFVEVSRYDDKMTSPPKPRFKNLYYLNMSTNTIFI